MKKRMIGVLLILNMVLSLTACAGETAQTAGGQSEDRQESADVSKTDADTPAEHRQNVKETDEETGEVYWLLADFEDYFECSQVKYSGSFGTVTQVKKEEQSELVTYGEQSAKLEILGVEETFHERNPMLRIATNSGFFNATVDFSDLSRLTFDIYNAMDYSADIRFFVSNSVNPVFAHEDTLLTMEHYEYCITKRIALEPGQWNHIEIPAEEMKGIRYDGGTHLVNGAEALDVVGAFCLMFDRGELHEEQQVYYIDNVRAYLKEGGSDAE